MVEQIDANAVLSNFSTKIKDLEERQTLLKEKSLLLGQSFLKQEEDMTKDMSEVKDEVKELRLDIERLKEGVQHLSQESENFSRREELRRVEKYMKIWEPLKFVKVDEVKKLINEALENFEEKSNPSEKPHNKNYIN